MSELTVERWNEEVFSLTGQHQQRFNQGPQMRWAMKRRAKFRVGQVVCDSSDGTYCRIVKILKGGILWCEMERGGTKWTILDRNLRPLTKREKGTTGPQMKGKRP